MGCRGCVSVDCLEADDFGYSIERRPSLYNYVFECPPGHHCFNPNTKVRMQCCDHLLEETIPAGATLAEAQGILIAMVENCEKLKRECGDDDTETNGDGDPIKTDQNIDVCFNSEICGKSTCPDGAEFRYCVRAGAFMATSCAEAAAQALKYANAQAKLNKICLSSLSNACKDVAYSDAIDATGISGLPSLNNWELVAGSLPTGLSMDTGWLTGISRPITGTPTTAGTYPFKVRVTAPDGRYMEKSYAMTVTEITTATPLPDANLNEFYTLTFTETGVTIPLWSISAGALPSGLLLDPLTGVLSGTPDTAGTYNFTVEMTDET